MTSFLDLVANASGLLAVLALGVSAGALVTEGAVLVPMWRAQRPEAFLVWYRAHAALLLKFFGPLEVVAALLVLAALVSRWLVGPGTPLLLTVAMALTVAVLLVFPLYFQRVNAGFESGATAPERVPGELARWARWHWMRTAFALGAFVAAVLAQAGTPGRGG
jgi:hypothetical protein